MLIMHLYKTAFIVIIFIFLHSCKTYDMQHVSQNVSVVEKDVLTKISDDPGLDIPIINTAPLPKYDYDKIKYGMTIGIERTPKGRLWACWVAGGDNEQAYFVLAISDDDGNTWSKPKVVVDPHDKATPQPRRSLVGNVWTDPLGRLWLFFDQALTYFDGRAGSWYTICSNPDSENPVWSKPVRIWHGCSLNKPTVLANGDWLLNISLWDRKKIKIPYTNSYTELDEFRMANIFVSSDCGKTWSRRGGVKFPNPSFDEACIIERQDGILWITSRTDGRIFESFSTDKGKTWSEPKYAFIQNLPARHFLRRLKSGRLLLVKHGLIVNQWPNIRTELTAFLSGDDGKTWSAGLLLDERSVISYPDGFEAPDGYIYISYDRNRATDGEILMARFREEDVLAGKFFTEKAQAKILITKAGAH